MQHSLSVVAYCDESLFYSCCCLFLYHDELSIPHILLFLSSVGYSVSCRLLQYFSELSARCFCHLLSYRDELFVPQLFFFISHEFIMIVY